MEDLKTGLVYNAAFDPALIVYDAQYQNEQAHSSRFRAHLDSVAEIVIERLGSENLLEVGCGKGDFLEMLQERGTTIGGFDPTYEGDNPAIQRRYSALALAFTVTASSCAMFSNTFPILTAFFPRSAMPTLARG